MDDLAITGIGDRVSGTNIGFTGTRLGMTLRQSVVVSKLLNVLYFSEIHHGGCYGADFDFHEIALRNSKCQAHVRIYVHPGKGAMNQSRHFLSESPYWQRNIIVLPEVEYLLRDRIIVNESDLLIACPHGKTELTRSGTWFTVRRARENKIPIMIVYPDGSIKFEMII